MKGVNCPPAFELDDKTKWAGTYSVYHYSVKQFAPPAATSVVEFIVPHVVKKIGKAAYVITTTTQEQSRSVVALAFVNTDTNQHYLTFADSTDYVTDNYFARCISGNGWV